MTTVESIEDDLATMSEVQQVPPSTSDLFDYSSFTEFQGYFTGGQTTYPMLCNEGVKYETSGRFGICCEEEPCAMATECATGVIQYDDGESFACGDDFSCVTMKVFQTPGEDVNDATSNILCGGNWEAHTIFRTIPPEPTSSDDQPESTGDGGASTSNLIKSNSNSSPQETGEPAETGASNGDDQGNSNGESNNDSDDGGGSKAWIAGAVIGPIILIVAIIGGIWFWRRRKGKKLAEKEASMSPVEGSSGVGPETSMMNAAPAAGMVAGQDPRQQQWSQSPHQSQYGNQYQYGGTPGTSPSPGMMNPGMQQQGSPPAGYQQVPQHQSHMTPYSGHQSYMSEMGASPVAMQSAGYGGYGQAEQAPVEMAATERDPRPVSELPVSSR